MRLITSNHKWSRIAQLGLALAAFAGSGFAEASSNPQYTVLDLGPVGPAGQPFHIADNGLVSGAAAADNGADLSVLYFRGHKVVISNPGLGGANSMPFGLNNWGVAVGGANTSTPDPNGEDFCGFQSLGLPSAATSCLPFVWQDGTMVALPTLDQGVNGVANAINNYGEIGGSAENTSLDPSCPPYNLAAMPPQFQQYYFKPVYWLNGNVQELPTVGGDPDGSVLAVNDSGQLAGGSGTCSTFNPQVLIGLQPQHAVLWQKDGTALDLGTLGGGAQAGSGHLALGINNFGQVVGFSTLSDDVTLHGFLWTKEAGTMTDLPPVPGIPNAFSSAIDINDSGVIVGVSTNFSTFDATIWRNGLPTDLNTLIPPHSPLHLMVACSVNARGQIIGWAIDHKGQLHGYQLDPLP
jgi:probable HAF family extracellular repeat protein